MPQPVRLICQKCSKVYTAKNYTPGRMAKCKACGGRVVSPQEIAEDKTVQVKRSRKVAKAPVETEEATMKMSPSRKGDSKEDSLALYDSDGNREKPVRTRLGRYSIHSEIARGGMGIVYRAYDPVLRRDIALKALLEGEGQSELGIKRFLQEARASARLKHPNIIAIHDIGKEDGQYFFTMDLVNGEDFDDFAERSEVKLRQLLGLVIEICRALQVAHDAGIIHRDLKPQNIMIDDEMRPIIMDFGLAKDLTSDSIRSMTGTVFGTPSYMSPEQAQGHTHDIDHRTDIYALGVILYELATGEKPFGGDTIFDTINAIVELEPLPPRALKRVIGEDLNTIILKCLEKEPDKRYSSMDELADDLESYVTGGSISARPVGLPVRLWRKMRKNTAAMIATVAVPAVILVGLTVYMLFSSDPLTVIRNDVESREPERMVAAMTSLKALLADGTVTDTEDITVEVIAGDDDRAAALAAEIAVSRVNEKAMPAMLEVAADASASLKRRITMIEAVGLLAGKLEPGSRREDAASSLAAMLDDAAVAGNAARALGDAWCGKSREALLAVAEDVEKPAPVRMEALGSIGRHLAMHDPMMKNILRLQGDEDEVVVAAAEHALSTARSRTTIYDLYGLGVPARRALEGAGGIEKMNARRQQQMMDILNEVSGEKKKESPIAKIVARLSDADADVRMAAACDLGIIGDKGALPSLEATLRDKSHGVRRSAGAALLKVIAKNPKAGIDVRKILPSLRDSDALRREDAAWVLGKLEATEAVDALVEAMGREKSKRTTRIMAFALAGIGDTGGLVAIAQAFKRHSDDRQTAGACLKALVSFGRPALPHLIRALGATSKRLRESAAEGLKEITGEEFGADRKKWEKYLESS